MAIGTHSSPPPPPPELGRGTLSSDPADMTLRAERTDERALRIALENRRQIGRPPNDVIGDPGTGMWVPLSEVVRTSRELLAWTRSADRSGAQRGGAVSRILWRIVEVTIPLVLGWFLLWLSGWHR
jgi:hypothetical protein